MASLIDIAKDPEKRRAIVADAAKLLDAEVGDKKGFSGKAVKLAFRPRASTLCSAGVRGNDAINFCSSVDWYSALTSDTTLFCKSDIRRLGHTYRLRTNSSNATSPRYASEEALI